MSERSSVTGEQPALPADPRTVFEDPIVYPGHEGHTIGVLYNECTDHYPTEPEEDSDEAADAHDEALEAFYEEHVALGDGDMWGCAETIIGDFCWTCYEASDAYDDGEEPPVLTAQKAGDTP